MANKPKSSPPKKPLTPFNISPYAHDPLYQTTDKVITAANTVKDNPQLAIDWAKANPVSAAGVTGLAVGGYLGYAKITGEYKIPSYEFNVNDRTSVTVDAGMNLDGKVQRAGITLRWKF